MSISNENDDLYILNIVIFGILFTLKVLNMIEISWFVLVLLFVFKSVIWTMFFFLLTLAIIGIAFVIAIIVSLFNF